MTEGSKPMASDGGSSGTGQESLRAGMVRLSGRNAAVKLAQFQTWMKGADAPTRRFLEALTAFYQAPSLKAGAQAALTTLSEAAMWGEVVRPLAATERGYYLYVLDDLEGAAGEFDRALAQDEDYPRARCFRGSLHFEAGRLSEAERAYLDVLEDYPDFICAHFALGLVARVRQDVAGQQRMFGRILEIDETNAYGWWGMANYHFDRNDYESAQECVTAGLSWSPRHLMLRFVQACLALIAKEWEESRSQFCAICAADDQHPTASAMLGLLDTVRELEALGECDLPRRGELRRRLEGILQDLRRSQLCGFS